jgi:hypothetical protein
MKKISVLRGAGVLAVSLAVVFGAACSGSDATSPQSLDAGATTALHGARVPGLFGGAGEAPGGGSLKGCMPHEPQYGTATIGPSGGELVVGSSRLIVPPGALTRTVEISGTTTADATPTIYLEPHGLQFKKPAGLILDASNCTDIPSAVYLDEIGVESEPIPAVYSPLWRTIAVPIDHFSGYAVAF